MENQIKELETACLNDSGFNHMFENVDYGYLLQDLSWGDIR